MMKDASQDRGLPARAGLWMALASVTEASAIAASALAGRGDEAAADAAATKAMVSALDALGISGRIVIGDGEEGDGEPLGVGQTVSGAGPELDLALDPLEGSGLVARDRADALSLAAIGARGSLMRTPQIYMEKLAIGPGFAPGLVTLEMSPAERVEAVAQARGCTPQEVTVCMLERPRHAEMLAELRALGARVRLISDGDIAGVIHCAQTGRTGVDIYMGSGGAPEGVFAAAALKCLGGQMLGRLMLRNDDDRRAIMAAGIDDPSRIYTRDDMVQGDVILAATGVTDGTLLQGVRRRAGRIETETLVMDSRSGKQSRIATQRPAG